MSPDKISNKCNRNAGGYNEFITEYCLVTECGNNFRNCSHGRQDHNIYGRMTVSPEQMLIKKRISTQCRIKKSNMQCSFGNDHEQGNTDNRSGQQLDPTSCIKCPWK